MKGSAKKIFDRLKLIRNRQFALQRSVPNPLLHQSLDQLIDNLSLIKKQFDGNAAYCGQGMAEFLQHLPANVVPKRLFLCDLNLDLLKSQLAEVRKVADPRFKVISFNEDADDNYINLVPLCCEEELWPFPDESLQLIVSNLHLHWVNELQVVLQKWHESLIPDGAVLGSMYGADTLQELRISYTLAENERYGGVSQHVSTFITITEIGNLISRLQYKMPSLFTERTLLEFDSVYHFLQHLQEIGESEALAQKRQGTFKETQLAMSAIYETLFRNENSKIVSTFEQIYFCGWKYHPSQQVPKERGSAEVSLRDIKKEIEGMGGETEFGEIEEEGDEESD